MQIKKTEHAEVCMMQGLYGIMLYIIEIFTDLQSLITGSE